MCKFRYPVLSPIRILLFLACGLFTSPVFFSELYDIKWFPIIYFFGAYFIFLNFPCIVEILHGAPTYYQDLMIVEKNISNKTFQKVYTVVMSFLFAVIVSLLAEYILIQGIEDKSYSDIIAIVGSNILVFMKIQSGVGKVLLTVFKSASEEQFFREVVERMSTGDIQIEISDLSSQKSDEPTDFEVTLTDQDSYTDETNSMCVINI